MRKKDAEEDTSMQNNKKEKISIIYGNQIIN